MTTQTTNRRYPAPLYAAAGAGELAYEQLRKLPARVLVLTGKVAEMRPEPKLPVDLNRVRTVALRNAEVLRTGVQVAQERATAVYVDLVARGEKVVGGPYKEMRPAGDLVEIIEPAGLPSAATTSAAAASVGAKPAKKTRPAAGK